MDREESGLFSMGQTKEKRKSVVVVVGWGGGGGTYQGVFQQCVREERRQR